MLILMRESVKIDVDAQLSSGGATGLERRGLCHRMWATASWIHFTAQPHGVKTILRETPHTNHASSQRRTTKGSTYPMLGSDRPVRRACQNQHRPKMSEYVQTTRTLPFSIGFVSPTSSATICYPSPTIPILLLPNLRCFILITTSFSSL